MLWLFIGAPLLFLILSLLLYKVNRASLAPSFMLTLFILSAAAGAAQYLYTNNSDIARGLLILLLLPLAIDLSFGLYAFIAFLLWNARSMLKKEGRTLAHSLTLILAVGLILYEIIIHQIRQAGLPPSVKVIQGWVEGLVLFYAAHASQYLFATFLCNLSRPRLNQDYVIVHGSGLKNGNVTPLLAGRVDRAIAFFNKQKKHDRPPKLLFSGGQGADEPRPEAEAMAEYAEEKGISQSDILLESGSRTTFENMKLSKQIMDADSKGAPYRAIYATSNYHLLRTGIYARRAGLKINGIGSRTALYYLPTALLREYIAYIALYWKLNVAFGVFGLLCSLGLSLLLLRAG